MVDGPAVNNEVFKNPNNVFVPDPLTPAPHTDYDVWSIPNNICFVLMGGVQSG